MLSVNHAPESPWAILVEDDESLEGQAARALDHAAGFRGELAASGLAELVQLVMLATPTGVLRLQSPSGSGSIWFEAGALVHATLECRGRRERGASAFRAMLRWRGGRFSVDAGARPPEHSILSSTMELLLDAARALDEDTASGMHECEDEREDECEDERAAEHFESGLQAVWNKDYARALPEWERAAALEPDNRLYQHNLMRLRRLMDSERAQKLRGGGE